MSFATRTWGRLSLQARLLAIFVPLALVAAAGGAPVLAVLEARRAALAGAEGECFLMVGPEGDWAPDELAALAAAGAVPVGLGSARLRVETAALALLAAVALQ